MMGFLDSFGDFAQGAIDTHLSQLEKQARDKHELAMADKAMEQRTTDQWLQDRQQRKMAEEHGERAAAEADARRKAARDEKDDARKWDREKLTATEAGKDRRHRENMARPRGETQGPAPQLFQTKEGEHVWVRPGDPVPNGARRINPYTPTREDSQPTDPNDWLSQF